MSRSVSKPFFPLKKDHQTILTGFLLLVVILIGFALRVNDLEGQSMWSDEGLSLYRARLPVGDILRGQIIVDGIETTDTNPALYFLLLHLWRSIFGETIFMLRYFGVAVATISIPLIYGLGSLAFGRRVGLLAGFFLALSPFHVWQSQVMRNYGFLISLSLLSVYALFSYILTSRDRRQNKWLIIWATAGLLTIYTHYFGFFIFAFGMFSLALFFVHQFGLARLVRSKWFWISIGATMLIVLPAIYVAYDRFRAGQQLDYFYVPIGTVAYRALSAFAVGMERSLVHSWWLLLPAVVLAVSGLYFGWRANRKATLLLLGYLLIPLGLLLALSLINPLYNGTRHLLIGLPPFLILVAEGVGGPFNHPRSEKRAGFRRAVPWFAIILGILVVLIQVNWLKEQFTSPRLIRDDVRGAAEYLNAHAEADDLIVIHDALIRFTFDTYYEGEAPLLSVPEFGQYDVPTVVNSLQTAGKSKERIWFLTEPTPRTGFDRQLLIDWADENWDKTSERSFPHMWLSVGLNTYLSESTRKTMPQTAVPLDVVWQDVLRMHGYHSPAEVTAGQDLWLTLYLSQLQDKAQQHTLSFRLVDENGQVWAQIDDVIAPGFPPEAATSNVITRYDHDISIPAGVPAGQYQIWFRLVETGSGQPLTVEDSSLDTHLTEITIQPATCDGNRDQLVADIYANTTFADEIELVAYSWPNANEARAGDTIPLKVWWCAKEAPESDYRLRLQVVDSNEQVFGESIGSLSRSDHPPTDWVADELLMGISGFDIPAWADAGEYELRLSLLEADNDESVSRGWWVFGKDYVPIGHIEVIPWPMVTELPQVAKPIGADFGQPKMASLHGYDLIPDLVEGNETLNFNLVWHSSFSDFPASYSVFIHLADDDERILAQVDGIPVGGSRPTTSWREDEVIVDPRSILIPADAEPGDYKMWIGLYDPATGQRLPIMVEGEQQADNRLLLQRITVAE